MLYLVFSLTLLLTAAASQPNRTYYVRPDTSSSTDCSANQTCLTLNQYAREQDTYFTTGASFLFLPGNHSLEVQVNLTAASDISLKSSGTIVNIICTARVAFRCENVTLFKIEGLYFHLLSSFPPSGVYYDNSSGLVFLHCSEVEISFSTFDGRRNSTESLVNAVISVNSSLNITQCTFNGNTAHEGGAIAAYQHSKIELTGNNSFIGNTARTNGGALYALHSSILLRSRWNVFSGNQADRYGYLGGAIYLEMSNAIIESGTNYTRNKASSGGGALCACESSIVMKGIHMFANNEAVGGGYVYGGGAICLLNNSNATIDGDIIFIRNKASNCGALYARESSVMLKGIHTFVNNEAILLGGGAIALFRGNATIEGNTIFAGNKANRGGGSLYASRSSMALKAGIHTFTNNEVDVIGGGAIHFVESNATLYGDTNFTSNKAMGLGGALYVLTSSILLKAGTHKFANNKASNSFGDGGAIALLRSSAIVYGDTEFTGNRASRNSGALDVRESSIMLKNGIHTFTNNGAKNNNVMSASLNHSNGGETNFTGNATDNGGAISLKDASLFIDSGIYFIRNNADHGGALFGVSSSIVITAGVYVSFTNNAAHQGGAIFLQNSKLSTGEPVSGHLSVVADIVVLSGITVFAGNTANSGGAIYSFQDQIYFITKVKFSNNTAHSEGGALYMAGSKVNISQKIVFTSNSATDGGAVYVTRLSTLHLGWAASFSSSYNYARGYGGVIYHDDSAVTLAQCNNEITSLLLPSCFLQMDQSFSNHYFPISWHHDSADIAGNFLFGGLLNMCMWNSCIRNKDPWSCCSTIFDLITTTPLASDPYRLLFCENDTFIRNWVVNVHRGGTFLVPVIALGQGGQMASAEVTAMVSNSARIELYQTHQPLFNHCTELAYNLYSSNSSESLELHVNGPCRDRGLAKVEVLVTLLDCPDGFTQQREECVCEERLQAFDVNCTVKDGVYVTKKAGSNFWMDTLYYKNGTYQGLILSHTCPMEYCKTATVRVPLTDLDQQCAHNRSGLLCGACATNYSLLLGGSRCAECSNSFLAFLLAFILAGVALVALLTFLKLTVATGMINGVILYANFVQANRKLFFPINTTNILTVFIAWLNLDLGFETCFYAGMDAYAQTWLQYTFPIYLWVLMSLIVLISRYSVIFSRVIGSNPVAVLATLLLMSYTKVLRIIIEVFSSIQLDYPDGEKVRVWLKDANVPHLQGKHLVLTVFTSLFLLLVFLPYTVFLLFSKRLYRLPNRVHLRWLVVKLKPLLDSYTAPYRRNTYYWTGFLLVVRCVLYIIFSVNSLGDTSKSFLAIIITFAVKTAVFAYIRVYTSYYVNMIEASLYLNLIILSAGTLAASNKAVLSHILVGIAFATTLGIMLYHFHLRYISTSAVWAKLKLRASALKDKILRTPQVPPSPPALVNLPPSPRKEATHSTIDLREPLLDNNNMKA